MVDTTDQYELSLIDLEKRRRITRIQASRQLGNSVVLSHTKLGPESNNLMNIGLLDRLHTLSNKNNETLVELVLIGI